MKIQFYATLVRLAQVQGETIDKLAFHSALTKISDEIINDVQRSVHSFIKVLDLPECKWIHGDRDALLNFPCLIFNPDLGYALLRGVTGQGQWVIEWFDTSSQQWHEKAIQSLSGLTLAKVQLARPYQAVRSPVFKLIANGLLRQKKYLFEIVIAGVLVNFMALATSIYSMQVYDRVVPTGATATLLALTLGVAIAVVFEFFFKLLKSKNNEYVVDVVDAELAQAVYSRFISVRLDQLPSSVGGLAGQIKGYETVRGFLSSIPSQVLIDWPFVLFFTLVVFSIGGWLGIIPLAFFAVSLALGLFYKRKLELLTVKANNASNLKTGLLVETVEGAETIKSGQGGWRMLMRWLQTTDEARETELEMRRVSEHSQFFISSLHQISYIAMVAYGSLVISRGEMTMGGLIACTILSGRILGPIAAVPSMLVQWGHTRAALQGLDRLWQLDDDHAGVDQPVVLDSLQGQYQFENVEASYGSNKALSVASLKIQPGEKIAVLGAVGSGKTTLLRLLGGMYKPQKGTILLDGVDLSMISKPVLAESIGYLQQEGRLFSGTLRENLLLGLIDPGDQILLGVSQLTGLQQTVLSTHPKGLHQHITEGGQGLSGGQKQLANLTRVFLRKPKIWLLDEPTASLDRSLEAMVIKALTNTLKPTDTLVLVTHKPELLALVDRIIVVSNHQIVLDGPKTLVLQHLQKSSFSSTPNQALAATPRPTAGVPTS